jgi:hypothetical protein
VGLVAERCRGQLLSGAPARTVDDVVRRVIAVQAQDPRGFRLAVRSRSTGLTGADVDAALDERRLVVSWLNRGTLHLVDVEDLSLLHALTTPQLKVGSARRLAQLGVTPEQADRGVRVVVEALTGGPRTRAELRGRLVDAGVPVEGQALVHVLFAASLRGLVVRGPVVGAEHAFVLVEDWLGAPLTSPPDREQALAELARRYLAGHAPASDRDLARWAGLSLGDARAGMAGVRGLHDRGDGLVALSPPSRVAMPKPRLLGPFDPLLLGWADRTPVVGDRPELVTDNGLFRPFVRVDGRAVATWSVAERSVHPFAPLDAEVVAALDAEAADVRRFLGSARYR